MIWQGVQVSSASKLALPDVAPQRRLIQTLGAAETFAADEFDANGKMWRKSLGKAWIREAWTPIFLKDMGISLDMNGTKLSRFSMDLSDKSGQGPFIR